MISCTTFILALFALFAVVASAPLQVRDVFVPPVTYPHAGTVWQIGRQYDVTWDTSKAPAQITNTRGMVVLATNGVENWEHPLASGFNILDGSVTVTVPQVTPGDHFAIVVFGDSGNYGQEFTIMK